MKEVILQKSAFKNHLFKYKNDIKDTWNIINVDIGKRKISSPFSNTITVDKLEITDKLLVAELLISFLLILSLNWLLNLLNQIILICYISMPLHLYCKM